MSTWKSLKQNQLLASGPIIFLEPKLGGKSHLFPPFSLEDGERSGRGVPTIPPSEPQKGTKVWASLQELPRLLASSGGGFGGNLTGNTTPPKMPVLNDGSLCFFPHLFFFLGCKTLVFPENAQMFLFFFGQLARNSGSKKQPKILRNSEKRKTPKRSPSGVFFRNNRGDCDTSIGFIR